MKRHVVSMLFGGEGVRRELFAFVRGCLLFPQRRGFLRSTCLYISAPVRPYPSFGHGDENGEARCVSSID
jgi:hypothetical protein